MNKVILAAALAVVLAACGGAGATVDPVAQEPDPAPSDGAAGEEPQADDDPDAKRRFIGFVTGVDADRRTIEIDPAIWLEGEAAVEQARRDGLLTVGETELPNGNYYILNDGGFTEVYPASSTLQVELVSVTSPGEVDVLSVAEFGALYRNGHTEDRAITDAPYWVTVEGGEITSVAQQYLP